MPAKLMLAFSPAVVVVAVIGVPSSVIVVEDAAALPAVSIATNATASATRGVRRRTCKRSDMGDIPFGKEDRTTRAHRTRCTSLIVGQHGDEGDTRKGEPRFGYQF